MFLSWYIYMVGGVAGPSSALVHRLAGELVRTENQNTVAEIVLENQQSREAVTYVLALVCIHGGWGGVSEFSSCSRTCGEGSLSSAFVHRLTRELVTTQNRNTVAEIVLENQQCREAVTYVLVLVCIHGGGDDVSEFSSYSRTCGEGSLSSAFVHRLTRELVTTQKPKYDGRNCPGKATESRGCNLRSCPGMYTWWVGWLV